MQSRAPWRKPILITFGSVADLTAGKLSHGTDALSGSMPELFCPPNFPASPNTPEHASSDAIIER